MEVLPHPEIDGATAQARLPEIDENGVDLTLVRYTLGLTPSERLKALENFMNAMTTVRLPPRE